MAQTLYSGFCQLNPLVINGSTSPIGEITNLGESYAKEPDRYYNGKGISELIILRGVAGSSQSEKIPTSHQAPVLDICDWLYNQAVAGKVTNNQAACLQMLIAEFSGTTTFNDIGAMTTDGSIWLPAHIDFTMKIGTVVHDFKIWFAIKNLVDEFPYRDIYVFGPVPPSDIDSLMTLNYRDLAAHLATQTAGMLQERIDKLLDGNKHPYSSRQVYSYDIYDLINKPFTTLGEWTVIIYGNPLNADDEVNEAIKDCILKNSDYTEADWEDKIPDLFNPLEFFVIPHFNSKGLENETVSGSTYSPIFQFQAGDTLALKYADFYDQAFIRSSLQIVPHLYKSVKMSIVGKPNNNLGQTTFSSIYGDYQLIPSTDTQFGMMSDATQDFIAKSEDLLYGAEIANDSNLLPTGVNKVVRKERLYVTMKIGKVKFTCITRQQFVKDGLLDE